MSPFHECIFGEFYAPLTYLLFVLFQDGFHGAPFLGPPRFGNICVQLYIIYYRQPVRSSWQHSVVLPRKYHVTDVRGSGRVGGPKGSRRPLITDREILHVASDTLEGFEIYDSEKVLEVCNNSTTTINCDIPGFQ